MTVAPICAKHPSHISRIWTDISPKLFRVYFWVLIRIKLKVYESLSWSPFDFLHWCWKVKNGGNNYSNLNICHIRFFICFPFSCFCSSKDTCQGFGWLLSVLYHQMSFFKNILSNFYFKFWKIHGSFQKKSI